LGEGTGMRDLTLGYYHPMPNLTNPFPRPIDGVLFDLDDTLYNRRATFRAWSEIFLRERLGITSDGECAEIVTWMESLDANGYGSKHAVIVELCARFPSAIGQVEAFYDEFVERVQFDPEAVELLDHLDATALPYGVITNGTARQQRKIDALRLGDRTSTILISDIFGDKKPSAPIFLAAAKSIGVAPVDILFVGDHPINDIQGARSVGMMTAWLHRDRPWPQEVPPADLTIDNLQNLKSFIR